MRTVKKSVKIDKNSILQCQLEAWLGSEVKFSMKQKELPLFTKNFKDTKNTGDQFKKVKKEL
jgi:hypothetical protein